MWKIKRLLVTMGAGICLMFGGMVSAQTNETALKLAVPEEQFGQYRSAVLPAIEAAFPNIRIELVPRISELRLPSSGNPIEDYLDQIELTANSADVILVSKWFFGAEAVQTGFFLDLQPLVSTDAEIDFDDFFPAVWDAYRWAGGLWALPTTAQTVTAVYDPSAFEDAGLRPPDTTWTFDDYIEAARKLAVTDAAGEILMPGLMISQIDLPLFFHSLTGNVFYDANSLTASPDFVVPEIETLLTRWIELEAEGAVSTRLPRDTVLEDLPFQIGRSYLFQSEPTQRGALLPNGVVGVDVTGFAISKGTNNPEAAYELVRFLSMTPEVNAGNVTALPVRRSWLADFELRSIRGGGQVPAETQAFIVDALERGSSVPLLYTNYFEQAWAMAHSVHAIEALITTEQRAEEAIALAAERGASTVVNVVPPEPINVDGVTINFGYLSPISDPLSLQRVATSFSRSDPEVRRVRLNLVQASYPGFWDDMFEQNDCVYTAPRPYMPVITLDPLMDADADYDPADVLPGVLDSLQSDGQTWGVPITIDFEVLRYHTSTFNQQGITLPEDGWTIEEFITTLHLLDDVPQVQPPYYTVSRTQTHIYSLVAAYGGKLFDYDTDPPTPGFNQPEAIEAIRKVLDLAKDDLMRYEQSAKSHFYFYPPEEPPLVTDDYSNPSSGDYYYKVKDYGMALFPRGTYTPVYYYVNAAFITIDTHYPEACYRWIKTLVEHPELFEGMPAYYSLLDAPATAASRGEDKVAIYQQFADYVSAENAYVIEYYFGDWFLRRAFDRYVLDDADLEAELAEAEIFTNAFGACYQSHPLEERENNVLNCMMQADPSLTVQMILYGTEEEE